MAHPQNSPRGLFAKNAIYIGAQQLTDDGTDLVFNSGIKINDARVIKANSTGLSITAETALPTTRTAGYNWTVITNSTGASAVAVRTTGTTWKYLNVTALLPT